MSHRRTFLRLADENGWFVDSDRFIDEFTRDGMYFNIEYARRDDRYRAIFYPAHSGNPASAGFGFTMDDGKTTEVIDLLTLPRGESVQMVKVAQ